MRFPMIVAAALAAVVATSGPAAASSSTPPVCVPSVAGLDLQTVTVPQLQAAMADGRLTAEQLVEAYLARIAAYDADGPKLNSVRALHPDALRRARELDAERRAGKVRGPLHGIPVLLKDNVATNDLPTTAGSIALEGVIPPRDATLVERFRAAGAIILGKANLSEFANWVQLGMPNGYSSLGGQVVNAHDLGDPSGSSAGSGVAASMAFSGVTIGTETSGSILSPSEANGVVGVKTTRGMVSRAGILPLSPEFDVPGPMVRSVTDAAYVLTAIAGPDNRDPVTAPATIPAGGFESSLKADALKGVRLAYSNSLRDGLGDEEAALWDDAVAKLEALGATVVGVDALDAQTVGASEIAAIFNDFKQSLNRFLPEELPGAKVKTLSEIIEFNKQHPDKVKYGQNLLEISDATPGSPELAVAQAAPAREGAKADIDAALLEGDAQAILAPGNAHANVGAAAGYPTVMVPLGYTGGGTVPVGLGFMGKAFTEAQLLGFAYAFEQASRARVAPTAINPDLAPGRCATPAFSPGVGTSVGSGAGAGAGAGGRPAPGTLPRLRATARRRGARLQIRVTGAVARGVRVTVSRGRRAVARRTVLVRSGSGRMTLRLRGAERRARLSVTVLDAGPPARTVRARVR